MKRRIFVISVVLLFEYYFVKAKSAFNQQTFPLKLRLILKKRKENDKIFIMGNTSLNLLANSNIGFNCLSIYLAAVIAI